MPTHAVTMLMLLSVFLSGLLLVRPALRTVHAAQDACTLVPLSAYGKPYTPPPGTVDIIINLAPEVPACLGQTRRVAEIIDGDDGRRRAGRARWHQG